MKVKMHIIMGVFILAIIGAGCGGSSGTTTSTTDTGTASLDSLSEIPTLDLSTYDSGESGSASVMVPLSHSVLKMMGEGHRSVGNPSRAGCEANMHFSEIKRMSQMSQLERCYPEAMETAGLITIPTGSYAFYKINPPAMEEEQGERFCDDIPAEDTVRLEACRAGGAESGRKDGMSMKMRIGQIDGVLQIDMCEGEEDAETLKNEASYGASGDTYTANVVHIGNWGGNLESNSFDFTVVLGADGYVTDGVPTIGADGSVTAISNMSGGPGQGVMAFERIGSDSSNRISGAFRQNATDPFSGRASDFTGRVYGRFNSDEGCGKFSGTGSMPPMRVQDMIPFDISEDNLSSFLQSFGAELGIELTTANYENVLLCDNVNFDPASPGTTPPMVVMTGDTCPSVTHSGVECFSVNRRTRTTDFGTEIVKSFVIIDPTTATYFTEVNDYDISGLTAEITTPAFSRNWDCTGDFTALDFASFTAEQAVLAEAAMGECQAIEEEAMNNRGMGGYDCNMQEQMNGVNDLAGNGPQFGTFGGDYVYNAEGVDSCVEENAEAGRLFVNLIDETSNHYCFPQEGECLGFTVANMEGAGLGTIDDGVTVNIGDWTLNSIVYDSFTEPASIAVQFLVGEGSCMKTYTLDQPDFSAPPEFGGEGEGENPGEGGFIPAPCLNADGTAVPEAVCRDICSDPAASCRG